MSTSTHSSSCIVVALSFASPVSFSLRLAQRLQSHQTLEQTGLGVCCRSSPLFHFAVPCALSPPLGHLLFSKNVTSGYDPALYSAASIVVLRLFLRFPIRLCSSTSSHLSSSPCPSSRACQFAPRPRRFWNMNGAHHTPLSHLSSHLFPSSPLPVSSLCK